MRNTERVVLLLFDADQYLYIIFTILFCCQACHSVFLCCYSIVTWFSFAIVLLLHDSPLLLFLVIICFSFVVLLPFNFTVIVVVLLPFNFAVIVVVLLLLDSSLLFCYDSPLLLLFGSLFCSWFFFAVLLLFDYPLLLFCYLSFVLHLLEFRLLFRYSSFLLCCYSFLFGSLLLLFCCYFGSLLLLFCSYSVPLCYCSATIRFSFVVV